MRRKEKLQISRRKEGGKERKEGMEEERRKVRRYDEERSKGKVEECS